MPMRIRWPFLPGSGNDLRPCLASIELNRYPEAGSVALASRFAAAFGVEADQVILGNGSDELIQILCAALARPGAEVMIPVPTFAMYRISALNSGLRVAAVPLDKEFDLDLPAMQERMAAHPPALTFLAWPNNPTGNCFRRERIEAILKAASGIVVVDEAYFHFSGKTFLPEFDRYENLVILRTLSKVGLAAMRIGLLIGPPALVHELHKVRLPYNLNSLSQAAAGFYLDEEEAFLQAGGGDTPVARRAFFSPGGDSRASIPGRPMQILFFLVAILMRIAYTDN